MGLPIIVDIVIGLAFIYLMLSLLASEVQELIATILQWRAKHLKDSIINLFASDVHSAHSVEKAAQLTKQVYQHPLVQGINQESRGLLPNFFRKITWFASYGYQKFTGKKEGEFGDQKTAPSYISREAFATALLEQLGTKHFIERLVEAKFSNFVDSINNKVKAPLKKAGNGFKEYSFFEKRTKKIEREFIDNNIDLIGAINSISERLNTFLEKLKPEDFIINEDDLDLSKDNLEELKEWKNRFFIEETEQIIKNSGLKPNLQEIVESIDKGSKTYHTYKEKFRRYEQSRFKAVHDDLELFENFLTDFLKGLLREFHQSDAKVLSNKYLSEIETLDTNFFTDLSGGAGKKFNRTKKPLSEINEIILEQIDGFLIDIGKLEKQNKSKSIKTLKYGLHAFREGFTGKTYLSDLQYFFLFRESIISQTASFGLFFILSFLLVTSLSNFHLLGSLSLAFQQLLLSRWGGLGFLILLVSIPLLAYRLIVLYFSRQKKRRRKKLKQDKSQRVDNRTLDYKKSLAGIFDDYFASDDFASKEDSNGTHNNDKVEFLDAISNRLQDISKEPMAVLYAELKDLGRSFRRYYLRFLLENADVDLVFVPTSVKQSLAVLIRRSKTSAKQAEDQILHLKEEVEAWYDRSMERAAGVYKRNAKGISILIGIALAIALNANSIHILDQLAFDQELRQTLALSAEKIAEQVVASSDELSDEEQDKLYRDTSQILDEMNLPIGWDPSVIGEEFNCELSNPGQSNADRSADQPAPERLDNDLERSNQGNGEWNTLFKTCLYGTKSIDSQSDSQGNAPDSGQVENAKSSNDDPAQPPNEFFPPTAIAAIFLARPLVGLKFLLGWILTGIAISMGASFWFDLLSKLVKVRNTGKPIPTTSETSDTQDATAASMPR